MMLWPIIVAALLIMGSFQFLEWRRADRRHLCARLAATLLAVVALALLGLRPAWSHAFPAAAGVHATLWTPLSSMPAPVPTNLDTQPRFALPGTTDLDPAASPVPDAAFLRRLHPEITDLRLLGDGLDPAELDALRGLRVEFSLPDPTRAAPGIRFLSCPRELPLGDPLVVQGSLGGLAPHTVASLTLEAPDATVIRADTSPADPAGEAVFTLLAPALPATGPFLWHLRVPASTRSPALDFPLGVAVVAPDLPRLLILESAPRFDTAALRRWFDPAGGTVVTRTQLGQDHYRYAATAAVTTPPDFSTLDTPLLNRFDLLLADTRAIASLSPAERDHLLAAVADTGLGVLLVPGDDLPLSGEATAFSPWKLSPFAADIPDTSRTARLQWPGQTAPTDLPIPIAPFEIIPGDNRLSLLGDHQGHTLAATQGRGRGQIALTLVRDTTRWQRENDPAAFAAYWSFLFSRLARPANATAGHWSLRDGDAGPVFVDHPLGLLWSGPVARQPGPAVVTSPAPAPDTTLALAPDPAVPGHWHGTFWPRRPGWHRVALASGGPAFDFHVSTADAWPALAAARRRAATARFAETSSLSSATPAFSNTTREEIHPIWLALVFFVSAGYLWIERRFAH